jgi:N-glycosylase/DNA lyase
MELDVEDFSLDKTLMSGQTFAWEKHGGFWFSFIHKPISVRQLDKKLEYYGCDENELKTRLGLYDDMTSIKAELDKDDFLDGAIEYSDGLRIIKDGLWPATLGFVLSIQSNIPLILKRIANLSKIYGKTEKFGKREVHGFPDYLEIREKGLEKLKQLKLGFRTKFVFSAAEYFYNHELSESLPIEDLKKQLLSITGVGDKVLDCIMLYGLHDLSAFPMDVWILRVLAKHYSKIIKNAKSYKSKKAAMTNYFGKYAGYAQLYIYNYSRLNKIK